MNTRITQADLDGLRIDPNKPIRIVRVHPRQVVMNENILGYILEGFPGYVNIHHASVLRGATVDRLAGYVNIGANDVIRDATQADFDAFRVSSKYHL